jgi:glycosyltransferase involved in cell wall biosynthesis
MNILMVTNTYAPHVGGVARSVVAFSDEYRRQGHHVLVVAPEFEELPDDEADVLRVPAVQRFNGSDFSVPMAIPGLVSARLETFRPDIVHSHHPFLLGDTALRVSASWRAPVVFTHHTRYDQYTHYVPGDSPVLRRFAVELAAGYSNLCDAVIAPSESIAELLREEGVETRIEVIPTGIDIAQFAQGDRRAARRRLGIPPRAFVVGHVGRLADEKNLPFLARAVSRFLEKCERAHFVIAGSGPAQDEIEAIVASAGVADRCHLVGVLQHQQLVDIYHCFDAFAFASQSETQGMVLTEAMAAGVPVVAVDASGVREVVVDGKNGRMLEHEDLEHFVAALTWIAEGDANQRRRLRRQARTTAEQFSLPRTASQALALYEQLCEAGPALKPSGDDLWSRAVRRFREELRIWRNVAGALGHALAAESSTEHAAE